MTRKRVWSDVLYFVFLWLNIWTDWIPLIPPCRPSSSTMATTLVKYISCNHNMHLTIHPMNSSEYQGWADAHEDGWRRATPTHSWYDRSFLFGRRLHSTRHSDVAAKSDFKHQWDGGNLGDVVDTKLRELSFSFLLSSSTRHVPWSRSTGTLSS